MGTINMQWDIFNCAKCHDFKNIQMDDVDVLEINLKY